MVSLGFSWMALFYLSLLLICLVAKNRWILSVFCFAPLKALGYISYFVYLFHQLVNHLTHYVFFSARPVFSSSESVLATVASLGVTLALGAVSWKLVERPFIDYGRRYSY
jgi:peptidoglycan/LPS O-acetylase OafA/YrhL